MTIAGWEFHEYWDGSFYAVCDSASVWLYDDKLHVELDTGAAECRVSTLSGNVPLAVIRELERYAQRDTTLVSHGLPPGTPGTGT